jgi:DNA mismatch repair ATPase MutS
MKNASPDSFVVLDELGRGTSTFDGIAIATAVLEYFIENVKCPLVFCTHYHVITQQFQGYPMVRNASMKYIVGDKLVLLHKLIDGPCSSSFGCEVARMCGLPESLTKEAQEVANDFEDRHKALRVSGSEHQIEVIEMRPELKRVVEDLKGACVGDAVPMVFGKLVPVIEEVGKLDLG